MSPTSPLAPILTAAFVIRWGQSLGVAKMLAVRLAVVVASIKKIKIKKKGNCRDFHIFSIFNGFLKIFNGSA